MSKMRQKSGKGSFRGIPFLIEDEQGMDGGRRLVRYEYPLRDDGMTEDLGLRLRNYHVRCLVIGDDHVKQAEKLIEALEKPESGTLKHPYFGTKEVRVEDYKAVYSTGHLRVTRFDISFIPAVNEIAPLAKKDSLFDVLNQYANALNVLADEFAEMIESVLDLIDELTTPIFNLVDSFIGLIETVFDGVGAMLNVGSELKNRIMSFKNRLDTLIRTPQLLAKELQSLVQFGTQGVVVGTSIRASGYFGGLQIATPTNMNNELKSAVNHQRGFVQLTALSEAVIQAKTKLQQHQPEMSKLVLESLRDSKTAQRSIHTTLSRGVGSRQMTQYGEQNIVQALQVKAQFVFLRLMQTSLVVEYGKAIVQAVTTRKSNTSTENLSAIESRADVKRYLSEIDEQLEQAIFDCADNEQWQSYDVLEQFRLALLLDLRTRGEQLADSKMVVLTDTQPALVVTFNVTDKTKDWERVVRRNQIRHPLFCLGGSTVEVLA